MRIELISSAWKADNLPLIYTRFIRCKENKSKFFHPIDRTIKKQLFLPIDMTIEKRLLLPIDRTIEKVKD